MYYAIYAGHGGSDPGAVNGSLKEKDYTLAVANKLAALLRGDGHRVLQNRTTDVSRNITTDANKANAAGVDCVVEVHLNSKAGTPATGTEVLYYSTGTSKTLAENIQKRIVAATGYANRGAKQRTNLGILKQTKMPATLVEMAFINNNSDMAKFNIDVMARAIRQGIYDTYGYASAPESAVNTAENITENKEEEEVTQAQFEQMYYVLLNEKDPIYNELADVPGYMRDNVAELMIMGAIKGDGKVSIGKRRSQLDTMIVMLRYYHDANPRYLTVDDCPDWMQPDVQALIDAGAIKGDGENQLNKNHSELMSAIIAKRFHQEDVK